MLLRAPDDSSCRKCGSRIAREEHVSWVEWQDAAGTVGPYHIECTPLEEDRNIARLAHEAAVKTMSEAAPAPSHRLNPSATASFREGQAEARKKLIFVSATSVACALLLIGIEVNLPYQYYVILRFTVCGVAALLAKEFFVYPERGWKYCMFVLAIVYNPILPIHLVREIWTPINYVTIPILACAVYARFFYVAKVKE